VDGPGSGSCPMTGFGISSVEPLCSGTGQLVTVGIFQINIKRSVTCSKITALFQIWDAS
jgi:hypothetical protein